MNKSYKYRQKSTAPDYDFGDDVLYSRFKEEKKKSNDNDIKVLVWMCLAALLVLSSFAAIKMIPGAEFRLDVLFSGLGMKENPSYQLGNVKLGTTMNILQDSYPNAQKSITADGSIALTFIDDDTRYLVWYGLDGPYHLAYKARQNRVIDDMSEQEFITKITQKYGSPSVSTCSQRMMDGMRDCRYSWWMPGQLRLDIVSRLAVSGPDKGKLFVTLTATDTHLEGRIRRAHLNTTTSAQ